eukprot:TRINITY_DN16991_c0_g1_i1.p1 TRINITY_DN16991_c0_g1~~TRINITY_DN16991_c0_g1_i1.p1  ORF type:complete len:106 (-),score=12.40 TRINITY_DN16991_c0_g1_i1:56-373(-)
MTKRDNKSIKTELQARKIYNHICDHQSVRPKEVRPNEAKLVLVTSAKAGSHKICERTTKIRMITIKWQSRKDHTGARRRHKPPTPGHLNRRLHQSLLFLLLFLLL